MKLKPSPYPTGRQHVEQQATVTAQGTAFMIQPRGMTSLRIIVLNKINDINILIRNLIIRLEDAQLATEAMACISGDRARINCQLSFLTKRRDQDLRDIIRLRKELKALPPEKSPDDDKEEEKVNETNSVEEGDEDQENKDEDVVSNSLSEVQWESDASEGVQEDDDADDTVIDYVEHSVELQQDTQGQDETDTYPNKNISVRTAQRLPWSEDEVSYVTDWVRSNPYSPVRALYPQIMESPRARNIFAFRHISSIDRLDYQFKKVRKMLGERN